MVLWLQWREYGDLPLAVTATFVSTLFIKRLQEVEDVAKFGGQVPASWDRPLIKCENPISWSLFGEYDPSARPQTKILEFQSVSMPDSRDSKAPGFQDSRIQRFQIPEFQDFKIPGSQDSRIPGFQNSEIPNIRIPTFQDSRVPGFQDSRILRFQMSEFQDRKIPKYQDSRIP